MKTILFVLVFWTTTFNSIWLSAVGIAENAPFCTTSSDNLGGGEIWIEGGGNIFCGNSSFTVLSNVTGSNLTYTLSNSDIEIVSQNGHFSNIPPGYYQIVAHASDSGAIIATTNITIYDELELYCTPVWVDSDTYYIHVSFAENAFYADVIIYLNGDYYDVCLTDCLLSVTNFDGSFFQIGDTVNISAIPEGAGCESYCQTIIQAPSQLTIDFSTFPDTDINNPDTLFVCQGQTIGFNNESDNADAYFWDFGDGNTSYDYSPNHAYAEAGTYTVSLTALNTEPNYCWGIQDDTIYYQPEGGAISLNHDYLLANDCIGGSNAGLEVVSITGVGVIGNSFYSPDPMEVILTYTACNTELGICETGHIVVMPCYYECAFDITFDHICDTGLNGYYVLASINGLYNQGWQTQYFDVYNHICSSDTIGETLNLVLADDIDAAGNCVPFPFDEDVFLGFRNFCECGFLSVLSADSCSVGGRPVLQDVGHVSDLRNSAMPPKPTLQHRANQTAGDTATLVVVVSDGNSPNISCIGTVCAGSTSVYSTDSLCNTYNWSLTGATSFLGQGTPQITVTWGNQPIGTITLGCSADNICLQTVEIGVIQPQSAIAGDTLVCSYQTGTYTAPLYEGTLYTWTLQPASAGHILGNPSGNSISIEWGSFLTLNSAQIILNYTNPLAGCSGSGTLTVYKQPTFEIIAPTENACLTDLSLFDTNNGSNFYWEVLGGNIVWGQNTDAIGVQWTSAGTHTVRATTLNNDVCNEMDEVEVIVLPEISTPNSISGPATVCPANTYNYSTTNLGGIGVEYIWTVTGGSIVSGQYSNQIAIQWGSTPPYSIAVYAQYSTTPACPSDAIFLDVNSAVGTDFVVSGPSNVCANNAHTYTVSPVLADSWLEWHIEPTNAGVIEAGQGTFSATVVWGAVAQNAVLSVGYCGANGNLDVIIHNLTPPVLQQSEVLCEGDSNVLSATGSYTNYLWKDENGNELANTPTLTVSEGGVYSLEVSDMYGCTALAGYNVHSNPLPIAHFSTIDNLAMCIQNSNDILFEAVGQPNNTYQWLFENNPIAGENGQTYTRTPWNIADTYSYGLSVTDITSGCSALAENISIIEIDCDLVEPTECIPAVSIVPPFISVITETCSSTTVSFANGGSVADWYIWNFGDGDTYITTTADTVSHNYILPGRYKVKVMAYYPSIVPSEYCIAIEDVILTIPIAALFEAEGQCAGSAVVFTDRSLYAANVTINNWTWDFGDGTPIVSGISNPTHIYAQGGTYTVSLTATDGTCNAEISRTIVVYDRPEADFVDIPVACIYNALQFLPNDSSFITYSWNFGNGTLNNAPMPVYVYEVAGSYDVSLSVIDAHNCVSLPHTETLLVNEVLAGSITAGDTILCAGETTVLTAPTGGSAYEWNTGDTTTTLTVTQGGLYWVKVWDDNGCYYTTPAVKVTVNALPPNELFAADTVHICNDSTLICTGISGYSYTWSNGLTTDCISASGSTYWVTVTNEQSGCQSISDPITIVTHAEPEAPNISPQNVVICEGESAVLIATHPTLQNFTWNNGLVNDSLTIISSGPYNVQVSDIYGCVASAEVSAEVVANPNADIFPTGCYNVCYGDTLTLPTQTNNYYYWYLNDTLISNIQNNSLIFTQSGDYSIHIVNLSGCIDSSGILNVTVLTNCDEQTLPVSLLSFVGTIEDSNNLLKWTTTAEWNSNYFTLWRSTDGINFVPITTVKGQGNSNSTHNYDYVDKMPPATSYYRLTQTDFDENRQILGHVLLRRNATIPHSIDPVALPVPFREQLEVRFYSSRPQNVQVALTDIIGRQLITETLSAQENYNSFTLPTAHLPKGIYVVQLTMPETGETATLKVLK